MPLHKPYVDDGIGGWVPQALTKEIHGVSDVVKILSSADAKKNGVMADYFHEQGFASLSAIAMDLRARGYEVELFAYQGEECIRLLASPAVGAKRRKEAQTTLFEQAKRSALDN